MDCPIWLLIDWLFIDKIPTLFGLTSGISFTKSSSRTLMPLTLSCKKRHKSIRALVRQSSGFSFTKSSSRTLMPLALSCKKRHNQSELLFGNHQDSHKIKFENPNALCIIMQEETQSFIIDCWHHLLALLVLLPSPFGCCASVLSEMTML